MPAAAKTARSSRLGLRATPEQEAVLRRAARVAHKSLTDFILAAAYQAAEQTLIDQRFFPGLRQSVPGLPGDAGSPGIRQPRALLTHPIDAEAEAFYRRFGFESTPVRERQLILLLRAARRFV